MKAILNKLTALNLDENTKLGYFDLAKSCLNVAPQGGFDVETMRARIKVADKLVGDKADLEDAEYSTLLQCVNDMKWAVVSKDIIEFSDYVKAPEDNK